MQACLTDAAPERQAGADRGAVPVQPKPRPVRRKSPVADSVGFERQI